ncbi:HAD family hydrolase [Pseudomonas purpurea]|uniref:HAD family hydrolase n=1 Tax=Pseudomonas purpurea TaxID=3136737 RepID=UPI003263A6E1
MDIQEQTPVPVLSVFDFDGTLTRHDSFVPFLRFAYGNGRFALCMTRMLFPGLRYLVGGLNRDELKAHLIRVFLTGESAQWVSAKAEAFCAQYWTRLLRPNGLVAVAAEVESGAIVTLCSASPALVLKPFAERLGIKLIATELEVIDGTLTGTIVGNNCRSLFKVLRLQSVYGSLTQFRIRAWGDTRGDHELLAAAQDPHWRVFHPAWRRLRKVRFQNADNVSTTSTAQRVEGNSSTPTNSEHRHGE